MVVEIVAAVVVGMQTADNFVRSIDTAVDDMPFMWFDCVGKKLNE